MIKKLNNKHGYEKYIELWKAGEISGNKGINHFDLSNHVRRYMLDKSGRKCENCGWGEINPYTGKTTLEIHHIDGDYQNSTEDNLQVLCPNCHSLTDNYRARNKSGKAQPQPKKR